jgi:hypothetical protein
MFLSQSRLHDPCEFVLRILRRPGMAKERSQSKTAAAYIRGAGFSKTGKRGVQKMREWQTKYRINSALARQNRLRSDACGQPRVRSWCPAAERDRHWPFPVGRDRESHYLDKLLVEGEEPQPGSHLPTRRITLSPRRALGMMLWVISLAADNRSRPAKSTTDYSLLNPSPGLSCSRSSNREAAHLQISLPSYPSGSQKTDRPTDLGTVVGEVNSRCKGVGKLAVLREISIAVGLDIRWLDQRLANIEDGLERD